MTWYGMQKYGMACKSMVWHCTSSWCFHQVIHGSKHANNQNAKTPTQWNHNVYSSKSKSYLVTACWASLLSFLVKLGSLTWDCATDTAITFNESWSWIVLRVTILPMLLHARMKIWDGTTETERGSGREKCREQNEWLSNTCSLFGSPGWGCGSVKVPIWIEKEHPGGKRTCCTLVEFKSVMMEN